MTANSQSRDAIADLVIVGGGLAGVSAATAAVRQGRSVTLISAHDRHPPDFRGEKLNEEQMELFDKFGLGPAARRQMTAFDGAWNHRFGYLATKNRVREYSSEYADLVNALRGALPGAVNAITAKVVAIETGTAVQRVTLADGRVVSARLLVLATGLGDGVRRMVGIEREIFSKGHSLSIGFNLLQPPAAFEFPSLVWGEDAADECLSYLTVFPIAHRMRGNLFVFRSVTEEWTRRFKADPQAGLRRSMPRLESEFGAMTIDGDVVARPIDIAGVRNHRQPGVVLLGDAFSVICPITGFGMAKALNDVDRLVNHYLPGWLASPGMGLDKVGAFYADPIKVALDARAMRDSLVGRRLKVDESLYWSLRRMRSAVLHRVRDRLRAEPLAETRRIG